ncbi:gluconate 5-dehydrogenase [Mucilaginibacter yixingensis]|uniref:Gluconate 5-dehydrogenase n=1 Tax=Mucilaginibacter yixingensis TaxID=1295612 RepID=A0A2T5JGQ0_9SPHI|nr:SDR family oxidoreductase [Mucilaginibacter yixingensis]PTR01536.1 gluconate 5-dehydrogenase [Mucilaginibacter yixingensis]
MIDILNINGRVALVTGGGTGIGFGIAQSFAAAGATVVITGRREDVLQEAVAQIGNGARYYVQDISKQTELPAFVERLEKEVGPIDILVNNAGQHLKKFMRDTTDQEFLALLQVHLLSVFSLSREVANRMSARKRGSILLISSMSAVMGMTQVVAYTTAKTALIGLMRAMMAEYSADNVRVNAIAPGWIESDMMFKAINADEQRKNKIMSRIPFNRFGKPKDIGNAALFLASDAAEYITGVFLPIDGGAAGGF